MLSLEGDPSSYSVSWLLLNSLNQSSSYCCSFVCALNYMGKRQGESCDSVCKLNGQSCVPNKLLALNQCEM